MKKIVRRLMCGVLLSSFILCGCNKVTETAASSVSGSQTEQTTSASATEPAPTEHHPEINTDNMQKVLDDYASKYPNGKEKIITYIDGIRGSGGYYFTDGVLYFEYESDDGTSMIQASIKSGKTTAHIVCRLNYKDTAVQGEGDTGIESFEKFIDDVISGNAEYVNVLDKSAFDKYSEDYKKDLPIVYSRFIAFADVAFSKLGLKLEDLGVDLGTKFRAVDPKQQTSMQVSVTNTHKFVNGFCTDCNMSWNEFYYDAIGIMSGTTANGWRSTYGRSSEANIKHYDLIQLSATNKKSADLMYSKTVFNDDEESESFYVRVTDASTKKKKSLKVEMEYRLQMKTIPTGGGKSFQKYNYVVTIKAGPGQYEDVFASKESLTKYAKVNLYVRNLKGPNIDAWGKKADLSKIKDEFAEDGFTYYTKEQVIDKLWEHHENFLASIDKGMGNIGLSLADIGVSWNKKD